MLISEEKRSAQIKHLKKAILKIASFVGIIFMTSTVLLMSVEATRNIIFNTIIRIQSDHIAFEFTGDGGNQLEQALPEGFIYMGSQVLEGFAIAFYSTTDGEQILLQMHDADNLGAGFDTDYREFTTIYINDQEVFLFESTGDYEHIIIWQKGNTVFQVLSNIDLSKLIWLTESLIAIYS